MSRAHRLLVLALVGQQAASAQEAPAAAMATVEIVGVAPLGGLGVERRLLPYGVQGTAGELPGRDRSDSLADQMARDLLGVNVNEVSGSLFQNDITYRGYRASPVLGTAQGLSVYLDGVRVNEPFGDVINWDMIPEAAIGSVLLVPASNPAYGLNTLGGALALATRSGLEQIGIEADISAGSLGRRRIDLSHGTRSAGGWHSFVAGTAFHDHGWRDHSAGKLGNLFVKVGHSAGAGSWSVSLLAGQSNLRGNGLLPDAMAASDRRAVFTFPDQTRNRLGQLTVQGSHRFDRHTQLALLAYARNSRRASVNGDLNDEVGEHGGVLNTSTTRQESQGASASLSMRRGAHRIDIGATIDRNAVAFAQFEQEGFLTMQREVLADPAEAIEPGSSVVGQSRSIGLYASDTWTIAPGTHLTASARYNQAQVANTLTSERGVQPAESFTYRRLNPALGIAHEMGPGLTLVANMARNNRVPTVIELGCADPAQPCQLPVGLQSDPYLKQVVSSTLEAGMRLERGGVSAVIKAFRSVNRDDILFMSSGRTRLGYFDNFERTRHQGVDVSLTRTTGRWTASAAYSFLNAVYDADGALFTGVRTLAVKRGALIAGLPKHTLKLGIDWNISDRLTAGADAQLTSRIGTQGNEDGLLEDIEEGDEPERADLGVRGFGLVNLRASWKPVVGWEIYGRINNAFDRRYATFGAVSPNPLSQQPDANVRFVAPGAPRSISFGVRYRF
ncbi:MAG: TonB-dependent receptor [Pseudomonadota bacterium]